MPRICVPRTPCCFSHASMLSSCSYASPDTSTHTSLFFLHTVLSLTCEVEPGVHPAHQVRQLLAVTLPRWQEALGCQGHRRQVSLSNQLQMKATGCETSFRSHDVHTRVMKNSTQNRTAPDPIASVSTHGAGDVADPYGLQVVGVLVVPVPVRRRQRVHLDPILTTTCQIGNSQVCLHHNLVEIQQRLF